MGIDRNLKILEEVKNLIPGFELSVKVEMDRLVLNIKVLDSRIIDYLKISIVDRIRYKINKIEKSRYSISYYFSNQYYMLKFVNMITERIKKSIIIKRDFIEDNKNLFDLDLKVKI